MVSNGSLKRVLRTCIADDLAQLSHSFIFQQEKTQCVKASAVIRAEKK